MKFTKGAVAGFIFGTVLVYSIGHIKISRIPWMMRIYEADRQVKALTKKETMVWLNDQAAELEILRSFIAIDGEDSAEEFMTHIEEVHRRAMTDPVYANLLAKLRSASD
jgi:hypothetical protein